MKTRIITAIAGLAVLAVVLSFFDTIVLNIAVSVISGLSVYELLKATNPNRDKIPEVFSIIVALLIPFFPIPAFKQFLPLCAYIIILTQLLVLIKYHKTMRFEQMTSDFFFSFIIPLTYTMFVHFRDKNSLFVGLSYVMISMSAAWLTDTGAYFVGVNFGKHKLCPEISPKKTVEGAVGGIVISIISLMLICWGLQSLAGYFGHTVKVNYIYILIFSPILSIISMVGDLAASVIKRQHGIKDFGNIMPGHGGIVDRFDSVLLVLPAVYIISKFFPLVV